MRIWSLHPQYLDQKGLGGQWEEGIIAQNTLFFQEGKYLNYPVLHRVKAHQEPVAWIGMYLNEILKEANVNRGYNYNDQLIKQLKPTLPMPVTRGQLYYEWTLLQGRLQKRDPVKMSLNDGVDINNIKANPMFYVIDGDIEDWERVKEK